MTQTAFLRGVGFDDGILKSAHFAKPQYNSLKPIRSIIWKRREVGKGPDCLEMYFLLLFD